MDQRTFNADDQTWLLAYIDIASYAAVTKSLASYSS